jgi:transcriptional regulator of arginine metabolism
MRTVKQRRAFILGLISERAIATQDELVSALQDAGVDASQASVSRDVAALGLAKVGGRYALPAASRPAANPLEERVTSFLLTVVPVGDNLLVLTTPPGEASGLALALDRLGLPGVAGTIAGDDTIFVAVTDRRARDGAAKRLRALMRSRAAG